MNYSDIVTNYDDSIKLLKQFDSTIEIFKTISSKKQMLVADVLKYSYNTNFFDSTTRGNENANLYTKSLKKFYADAISIVKSIDSFKLGNDIYELKNSNNNIFENFIKQIYEITTDIHGLLNTEMNGSADSDELLVKILGQVDMIIQEYKSIINFNDYLHNIQFVLANGKDPVKDNLLDIRLLETGNNLSDAAEFFEEITQIYEDLCNLSGVNSHDEPLRFERMESGSLLTWLNGNPELVKCLTIILCVSYHAYHNHFSEKAKIEKAEKKINIIKNSLDIVKELEKCNISIVDKTEEDIKQLTGKILNNLDKITTKNPEAIINKEKFILNKDIKKLEEKKFLNERCDNLT